MDGFDIGLPSVCAWGDGGVGDAVKGLNGFNEAGVVSGCVLDFCKFGVFNLWPVFWDVD